MIPRTAGSGFAAVLDGISASYLNRLYPEEWVLAEVLDSDASKRPTRVRVLAHSPNRQDIYSSLMQSRGHLALLFVPAPKIQGLLF